MKRNQDYTSKKKLIDLLKILDHFNINDLTANHASVLSSNKKGFFMNQHKHLFSQVNANNLVYVDLKNDYSKKYSNINKAGFYIHKFIHNSAYKPRAILHTHSINSVAISCLKEGFKEKLNQSSMRFFKRVEYLDYSGMVIDKKIARIFRSSSTSAIKGFMLIISYKLLYTLFYGIMMANNNNLIPRIWTKSKF